jgi:hypothetical protein
VALTQEAQGTVYIYLGYYSRVIEIRQSTYPANFMTSLSFAISNQVTGNFLILPASTVNLGYTTSYIRIAALSTVATGLYSFQFTKSGDTNTHYTEFPPLNVIVQNTMCSLSTK